MGTQPLDAEAVAIAFARIADRIQKRTGSSRLAALQRAIDEHPVAYERYLSAIQEGEKK
jgi:hypothetical protein